MNTKKKIAGITALILCSSAAGYTDALVPVNAADEQDSYVIKAEYPVDFTVGGYYVEDGAVLALNYIDNELTVEVRVPVEVDAKENEDISFGCIAFNKPYEDVQYDETANRAALYDFPWRTNYEEIYYFAVPNRSSIIEPQTLAKYRISDWQVGDVLAFGDYEYMLNQDYHFVQMNGSNVTALKKNPDFEPTPSTAYCPGFPLRKKPCEVYSVCGIYNGTEKVDEVQVRNEITVFSNGAIRVQTFLQDDEYQGLDLGCEHTMMLGTIKTSCGYKDATAESPEFIAFTSSKVDYNDDGISVTGTANGVIFNGEMLCEVTFWLDEPMEYAGDCASCEVYGATALMTKTDGSVTYKVQDLYSNDFLDEDRCYCDEKDIVVAADLHLPEDMEDECDPLLHRNYAEFYDTEEEYESAVAEEAFETAMRNMSLPVAEENAEPETPPMPTENSEGVWFLQNNEEEEAEEEIETPDCPWFYEDEDESEPETPPMPVQVSAENNEEELEPPACPEEILKSFDKEAFLSLMGRAWDLISQA